MWLCKRDNDIIYKIINIALHNIQSIYEYIIFILVKIKIFNIVYSIVYNYVYKQQIFKKDALGV